MLKCHTSRFYLRDLVVLTRRSVRYVGLLGPKPRREKLVTEVERTNAGWYRKQIDRLHAPAGLDIGAEGPTGIALSIGTEMQGVQAGRGPWAPGFPYAPHYSLSSLYFSAGRT